MNLTHEQLKKEYEQVLAAKTNAAKFNVLYDKYFESIFNYIFRRTDDENLCADLTSQTFLKALQNLKKYEYRGVPFSAWLFRIASNEVNKYYQRVKRKMTFSLEEERLVEVLEDNNVDPDEKLMGEMIEVLNDLPTKEMLALELRFFEGKSFKEISYILNISESGAKMRVYRTLQKMKHLIEIKNKL